VRRSDHHGARRLEAAEIGSNQPIYSGRDGVKKYDIAEIEAERRNG
jgi:hypothetical protein